MTIPPGMGKKILLSLLLLAVAVLIGYAIFRMFFFTSPISETFPEDDPSLGDGFPQAGPGIPGEFDPEGEGIFPGTDPIISQPPLSSDPSSPTDPSEIAPRSAFATMNNQQNLQFYNPADNRFYTVNANGEIQMLADQQFFNVSNVIWAPGGDKAIIEYPDGNKINYNFQTNRQVTLPKHWKDFDFSPNGDQIVSKSIGLDPQNRWLIVSSDDGSQSKAIEPLGDNERMVISSWSPNNQMVAMYVQGVDFNRKEVFFVGQNNENFKSIITEGRDFRPLWSPTGQQLVYSVYSSDNDYKPTLWTVDAHGDAVGANRRPLNLNTWADKCTFAGNNGLYCAVPQRLERGAGMLPEIAANTPDVLYRINLQTGLREMINTNLNHPMTNLRLSPDGNYLYYIDPISGRLMRINL